MRAIIFGIIFGCVGACMAMPLHKVEGKCVELKDFSKAQKNVILKAFKYGLKSGYGYTMAAIAWKESCAGEYKMNFADPSAGIYHAHIPGLLKKTNQKDTGFMRNMVGELLVRDDEYASQVALDELLYWHKVRNGNWQEVIKSYNKGFSWERDSERDKMAQSYYEDIARKVKAHPPVIRLDGEAEHRPVALEVVPLRVAVFVQQAVQAAAGIAHVVHQSAVPVPEHKRRCSHDSLLDKVRRRGCLHPKRPAAAADWIRSGGQGPRPAPRS